MEQQTAWEDEQREPYGCAGELHGFGYRSRDRPYLHYFVIGAGGLVKKDMSINIPDPVMMHDFAMTEQHVVFLDFPLMFSAKVCAPGWP